MLVWVNKYIEDTDIAMMFLEIIVLLCKLRIPEFTGGENQKGLNVLET